MPIKSKRWFCFPTETSSFALEIAGPRPTVGLTLILGGEDDVVVGVSLGLFSVWASGKFLPYALRRLSHAWAQRKADELSSVGKRKYYAYELNPSEGRSTEIRFSWQVEPMLSMALMSADAMGTWWFGWRRCFFPLDLLLGPKAFTTTDTATKEVVIPLPEGTYTGKLSWQEMVEKRPRWFAQPGKLLVEVSVEEGIPIPGKGENAHDCGDNAIFTRGGCYPLNTDPMQVVHDLVREVLERRGPDWKPRNGWVANTTLPSELPNASR